MPASEVVARIQAPGDPGSTRQVIVMDAMFRGGNPFASDRDLVKRLDQPPTKLQSSIDGLRRTFAGDRISMLHTMGFQFEQTLLMNAVDAEIGERFDPALGTCSATEQTARRAKNLPCTREEAAERLLRSGLERSAPNIRPLSYRSWVR